VTVFEHAMLGVTGTLAVGLHRRYGWKIVAAAGAVAVLPDWDGLSILCGAAAYDRVHRAWGHNLLVAGLSGAVVMACVCCLPWATRGRKSPEMPARGSDPAASQRRPPLPVGRVALWAALGAMASLSHLAADLMYSHHERLPDWGVRLLWPFSQQEFAYPMVPWGDVGTTLIFVASMFAMARWPARLQSISQVTLVLVVAYFALRGLS
jgi:membrane-bound metal-dependent hydrolase YbcI (DUF457 family)